LGLLIERPSYGYELLKRFEREYEKLLPLSGDSHIYTALNALASKGLIEEFHTSDTRERNAERQPKPRYRATVEGERCFLEWVIGSRCEDRRQWRLFLRQLAVFASRPEIGIQIIQCCEESYLKEAADASHSSSGASGCDGAAGLAARLLCEESRLTIEARLPWVAYARREFEALADGDQRDAGGNSRGPHGKSTSRSSWGPESSPTAL
jgi:DNA-binding PadR family transcriptional regulator